MSAIKAIRTVCQRITRRLKVYEYTTSSGDVVLTVKTQRYHDGVLWEGAWVELFGANEKRRYQVIKLTPFDKQPDLIEVTLNITDLDSGVKQLALLLDYQFGHKEEIQQTLVEQSRDADVPRFELPNVIDHIVKFSAAGIRAYTEEKSE